MKSYFRFLVAAFICIVISTVCLGYILKQKLVTVNESSYSSDTLVAAKGEVRENVLNSLKSECQFLGDDFELVDYKFESFKWEKDRNGGWESYASARGTCDDKPNKYNRLIIASENSYSADTRAEAEAETREDVIDTLKSECQSLDGDYNLADYNFQFFESEKDKNDGWESYADAIGTCKMEK